MQNPDLTSVLFQDNPGDDEEFLHWPYRRRRTPKDPNRFPKIPSEQGMKLMRSGVFGANDYNFRAKKRLATRMLERELALGNREDRARNNALINQVCYATTLLLRICLPDSSFRAYYHKQERKRLFISMTQCTPGSSRMMATSFSPAHKTSKFECTTPPVHMIGSTTRQSHIPGDNGHSQMHL
jgi:hypothetical protein